MKRIFFVLFAGLTLAACESKDKKAEGTTVTNDSTGKLVADANANEGQATTPVIDTANLTTIQWLDSTFLDLGKQKEGKEIEITFRFKNTGTKNLVIANVTAGCGCTIPERPDKPFLPGEEGVIKAKFNGSGHGETRKDVHVTANTNPQQTTLTFRAELVEKK